jgi:hypothetical protein
VLLDVMRRAGSPWRGEYGGVVACPGEQRLNGGRRFLVGGAASLLRARGRPWRADLVVQEREGGRRWPGTRPWPGAHAGGGGFVSHPVLKAKPNALITCAPGSSYTHA